MDQDAAVSVYSEALCHAVLQSNRKLAQELLKAGANVNHSIKIVYNDDDEEDYAFETPINSAVDSEDVKMVKLALKYNPDVNDAEANGGELPLVRAAQNRNLEIAKTLLGHPGIIVNARDSNGHFALAAASIFGAYEIAKLLVDHGEYSNDEYSEALSLATGSSDRMGIMKLLLEHGADANHPGSDQFYPPLCGALLIYNQNCVRLLIRNGATLERPFQLTVRYKDGVLRDALTWLSEDTSRTILDLKAGFEKENWDEIVAALWFHYFGPDHEGDPPRNRNYFRLSNQEFKMTYKWMIHAVSSLLFLEEANLLLPHLCRVFDPSVALELCDHTGKTPLLLALEAFPHRNEQEKQNASKGTDLLIGWNPDALKILHPETQRIPMTCAIVNRVPVQTLLKMVTCKKEKWFTASPLQQDPVTSLPNYLLIAQVGYKGADVYAFSRSYLLT